MYGRLKYDVGLNDGIMTEVQGDELQEGLAVVTGEEHRTDGSSSSTTNPFAPQLSERLR